MFAASFDMSDGRPPAPVRIRSPALHFKGPLGLLRVSAAYGSPPATTLGLTSLRQIVCSSRGCTKYSAPRPDGRLLRYDFALRSGSAGCSCVRSGSHSLTCFALRRSLGPSRVFAASHVDSQSQLCALPHRQSDIKQRVRIFWVVKQRLGQRKKMALRINARGCGDTKKV